LHRSSLYYRWRFNLNKQYESNKEYHKNHIDKCRENNRESQYKRYCETRNEIYKLLGGKCINPFNLNHGDFIADKRCLQIDHIKGGGHKQRKEINGGIRLQFILKQIKAGSKDYQLLCANCNWIKRFINKEFPQHLNKTE
jgi:hypothetical protein